MFDLTHLEFSNSKQRISGGNFISESKPDISSGEGKLIVVVVEKLLEVDDDALSGLRSEISGGVSPGSDVGLEHEVVGGRVRKFVFGDGGHNGVLVEDDLHLVLVVVLCPHVHFFELGADLLGDLGVGKSLLAVSFEEVVSPEGLLALFVLDHQVGEAFNMAGVLEDDVGGEVGAAQLEHVLLEDVVFSPDALDVVLDGASDRAVVEEASHSSVNFEGLVEHEALLHEVVEEVFVLAEEFAVELGFHSGIKSLKVTKDDFYYLGLRI